MTKVITDSVWPLAVLLLWGCLCGCSQDARYRTLCIFFDGVPDPNAVIVDPEGAAPETKTTHKSGRPAPAARRRTGKRVAHKAYAEFQCDKCHVSSSARRRGRRGLLRKTVREGLCDECHKELTATATYVHAPVLVKVCLECHVPHESRGPGLLLGKTTNVCSRCHRAEDMSREYHPRPTALTDADCIRCHDPHAGDKRYFIKPEADLTWVPESAPE